MQDQLKSNFFSIALQGQPQKNIAGGKEKTTLSFPPQNKANKKPSKKPKPKIKQLIRICFLLMSSRVSVVGLCWLIMCVAFL